jgi:hypothetical protein
MPTWVSSQVAVTGGGVGVSMVVPPADELEPWLDAG